MTSTDPFIRLWAQDTELLLFNVVLPWNMTLMSETIKIEKLKEKNYQLWKYSMKLILMECGLWGFTQEDQETPLAETATTAVNNAFQLRSEKAYSLIALNVERDLQLHISSVINPLEAWKILQKHFEFVLVTQIVHVNPKVYAASMKECRFDATFNP